MLRWEFHLYGTLLVEDLPGLFSRNRGTEDERIELHSTICLQPSYNSTWQSDWLWTEFWAVLTPLSLLWSCGWRASKERGLKKLGGGRGLKSPYFWDFVKLFFYNSAGRAASFLDKPSQCCSLWHASSFPPCLPTLPNLTGNDVKLAQKSKAVLKHALAFSVQTNIYQWVCFPFSFAASFRKSWLEAFIQWGSQYRY